MTGQALRVPQWVRAGAVVAVLAVLVAVALREVLEAPPDRLPGTDAGLHYTWEVYARSVLRGGRLPHWNPFQYAGMPHLANFETMVLYPPAMLLRWLPAETFLAVLAVLHLVAAGAGVLFLGRVVGLGWLACFAASVGVALGGSVGTWLQNGHLLIINSVAWLPWALGAAILTVRRRRLLPHPALPLILLLQLLAGYPQGTLYVTAVVALYFLYSAAWPDRPLQPGRGRPLAQLAILGLLTLGLTAFQFLPLVRLTAEAARTGGLSYEDATQGEWALRDLATFLLPNPPESERVAYVGWLLACAVPLAFFDPRRRRIAVFLAILTVAAVALALGDNLPLYKLHHALFPGFRIPGRALFVATLSLAMLGAIGLAWLVTGATAANARRLATVTVLCSIAAAVLVAVTAGARSGGWAGPIWIPILAVTGLAAASALGPRAPVAAFALASALVALELTTFAAGPIDTIPADSSETIRRWLGPPDGGRAITLCEQRIPRGAFSLAGRPSIAGPLGMNLRDYVDWLTLVDVGERPSDTLGRFRIRRDLLDAANVSTIVACEPLEAPSLTLVSSVDSVLVYRNDAAWPRAVWICGARTTTRAGVMTGLREGRYAAGRLVREAVVTVRWAPDLDEEARRGLESRYGLVEGAHREGPTWRYVLRDAGAGNVAALVREPLVDDTHGIDRQTGTLTDAADAAAGDGAPASEMVVEAVPCPERGRVDVVQRDQPDGHVVAEVDAKAAGHVFFSEPYYPERIAYVDGARVDAVKANLAFTAVPVPEGRHRVELRFVPASFRLGLFVTTATLGAWVAAVFVTRRRSGP